MTLSGYFLLTYIPTPPPWPFFLIKEKLYPGISKVESLTVHVSCNVKISRKMLAS